MNKRSYQSTLRGPNARGKLDEMPLNETTAEQDERMQKAREIAAEVLARLRAEQDDPFADPQPPSEAEQQAREAASYEWLLKDVYMEGDTTPLQEDELKTEAGWYTDYVYNSRVTIHADSEHRTTDANGENAQVYMHRRFSGSDYCSEQTHKLPPGRKVIVTASFAERWTDNPEHYKERFNAQDVEIKP